MAFKLNGNGVFLGEQVTHPDAPPTGEWLMYFLSTGLYIMDDTSTYTQVVMPTATCLTISDGDVSNPPTDGELDALFGTPVDVGNGFTRLLDDNGGGTDVYLVLAKENGWWYTALTQAV